MKTIQEKYNWMLELINEEDTLPKFVEPAKAELSRRMELINAMPANKADEFNRTYPFIFNFNPKNLEERKADFDKVYNSIMK